MASIFISYASQDADAADALHDRLTAWGFASVFLAQHAEHGIPTGADWEQQLYTELRTADAIILLGSPASLESQWCFAELRLARASRTPVFPVWLGGEGRQGLLDDRQWVDVSTDAGGYNRLRLALETCFDARVAATWDPRRSPYPGLKPFNRRTPPCFSVARTRSTS